MELIITILGVFFVFGFIIYKIKSKVKKNDKDFYPHF